MMMNRLLLSVLLPAVLAPVCAYAQTPADQPAKVVLSGITFSRSLNGAERTARVAGQTLTLKSEAKRDNFRDPDGKLSNSSAPMLLAEVDNTKPFTLTGKITPTFLETYDAGAFYIWVKDDLWLKLAMERDERKHVRIVSVRTIGTSDDNNHDVVTAKSVYLKISSDTRTVAFYYSLDNKTWQLVRLFRNDYPARLWLGVSTQSPLGQGTSASFQDLLLTSTSVTDFRLGQ